MRKHWAFILLAVAGAALAALFVGRLAPSSSNASSHREAPLISEDPTADNTDLYAFRSPDKPNTLTIVSNWIPGEDPAAGPNYYTFSQTREVQHLHRPERRRQAGRRPTASGSRRRPARTSSATRSRRGRRRGTARRSRPARRRSTTSARASTGSSASRTTRPPPRRRSSPSDGVSIFAGQRDDPFFADVGAIFDLVAIRKAGTTGNKGGGKDFLSGYNVHTIALQIPIAQVDTPSHTIGVWSSTDRQNVTVNGKLRRGWTQVSRLGEPLINEVVIPTGLKDLWNRTSPAQDAQFKKYYKTPILAAVLNKLYKLGVPETGRDDLVAVLGTGIPKVTFTGNTFADELRHQPVDPGHAGGKAEPHGRARRRQRRLPERPPARRRHRRHRGAGGRRLPQGQEGAARRRRQRQRRWRTSAHFPYVAAPHSGYANAKATKLGDLRNGGPARRAGPPRSPDAST